MHDWVAILVGFMCFEGGAVYERFSARRKSKMRYSWTCDLCTEDSRIGFTVSCNREDALEKVRQDHLLKFHEVTSL